MFLKRPVISVQTKIYLSALVFVLGELCVFNNNHTGAERSIRIGQNRQFEGKSRPGTFRKFVRF